MVSGIWRSVLHGFRDMAVSVIRGFRNMTVCVAGFQGYGGLCRGYGGLCDAWFQRYGVLCRGYGGLCDAWFRGYGDLCYLISGKWWFVLHGFRDVTVCFRYMAVCAV